MKKTFLLLLLIFGFQQLQAQYKALWSEPFKISNLYYLPIPLMTDDSVLYSTIKHDKGKNEDSHGWKSIIPTFERYDLKNMTRTWSSVIEAPKNYAAGTATYQGVHVIGKQLALLTYDLSNGQKIYYLHKLNANGVIEGSRQEFLVMGDNVCCMRALRSPDESLMLLYYIETGTNGSVFHYRIADSSLAISLPRSFQINVIPESSEFFLDNSGNISILYFDFNKKDIYFKSYDRNGMYLLSVNLFTEDNTHYPRSYQVAFDDSGNIYIGGTYTHFATMDFTTIVTASTKERKPVLKNFSNKESILLGSYMYKISLVDKKITASRFDRLSKNDIAMISNRKIDKIDPDKYQDPYFDSRRILIMKNNITLVTELHYTYIYSASNGASANIFVYGDIVLYTYSASLSQPPSIKKINKYQEMKEDVYSSFSSVRKNDKAILLLNDHPKNSGTDEEDKRVTAISPTALTAIDIIEGKITRSLVGNSEGLKNIPIKNIRQSGNKILLLEGKEKKYRIGYFTW